jgi:hypothetical protein
MALSVCVYMYTYRHTHTYKQFYCYPVKTAIHFSLQFLYSLYCMFAFAYTFHRMYYEYDQTNFKF